jgi:DNA-binding response OmpR family regulator
MLPEPRSHEETEMTTANPSWPRVLILDDEEPILFAMQQYFEVFGFEVDTTREAEEAEALLDHIHYGAVIADLRLSGIGGNEGLRVVRYARERCPKARIIVLTAYGSPEVEGEAHRLGADCFVHKPIPLPDIAQIVLGLLAHDS